MILAVLGALFFPVLAFIAGSLLAMSGEEKRKVITATDEEEWDGFWRCPTCGVRVVSLMRSVDPDSDRPQRCGACVRTTLPAPKSR